MAWYELAAKPLQIDRFAAGDRQRGAQGPARLSLTRPERRARRVRARRHRPSGRPVGRALRIAAVAGGCAGIPGLVTGLWNPAWVGPGPWSISLLTTVCVTVLLFVTMGATVFLAIWLTGRPPDTDEHRPRTGSLRGQALRHELAGSRRRVARRMPQGSFWCSAIRPAIAFGFAAALLLVPGFLGARGDSGRHNVFVPDAWFVLAGCCFLTGIAITCLRFATRPWRGWRVNPDAAGFRARSVRSEPEPRGRQANPVEES